MKIKTKRIAAMILAAVMLFGVSFSVARCCYIKSRPSGSEEDANAYPTEVFESGVYNPVKTEYAAEYLGTISRRIPETSDGGLERYPRYAFGRDAGRKKRDSCRKCLPLRLGKHI